jgi:sugar lactone lactonase YvrE
VTVPAQARRRLGEATVVSDGHSFLEGPRWHDGSLYASDFYEGRVLRWRGSGPPETVCEVPAQPSGLGWTPDGDLLVVSMTDRRLLRLRRGRLEEVADFSGHAPWHCNDMVVDDAGRAYVGNFGWDDETDPSIRTTVLLRADPDGGVCVAADGLVNPNGMAITPDGRMLLVNETFAARVTAFDRAGDGTLGNRRVWAAFAEQRFSSVPEALMAGVVLPDGIALDREGAAWLGDCRGSGAVRVAEGGEVLETVSTGDHASFALALGGGDRRTLFLCTGPAFGGADPSTRHAAAMCRTRVRVPGAGRP